MGEVVLDGRPRQVRVSVCRTACGERVVLHLVSDAPPPTLAALGLDEAAAAALARAVAEPRGMVLVASPPGSATALLRALGSLAAEAGDAHVHAKTAWTCHPAIRKAARRVSRPAAGRRSRMAVDIVMPHMGESVAEGTVLGWLKAVGDEVAEDEPLVEIATDKINVEVPAPASGVLTEILTEKGGTVEVGQTIGRIGAKGEKPAAASEKPPSAPKPKAEEKPGPKVEANETPEPRAGKKPERMPPAPKAGAGGPEGPPPETGAAGRPAVPSPGTGKTHRDFPAAPPGRRHAGRAGHAGRPALRPRTSGGPGPGRGHRPPRPHHARGRGGIPGEPPQDRARA
jgi:biotin carboxyl carrier protein